MRLLLHTTIKRNTGQFLLLVWHSCSYSNGSLQWLRGWSHISFLICQRTLTWRSSGRTSLQKKRRKATKRPLEKEEHVSKQKETINTAQISQKRRRKCCKFVRCSGTLTVFRYNLRHYGWCLLILIFNKFSSEVIFIRTLILFSMFNIRLWQSWCIFLLQQSTLANEQMSFIFLKAYVYDA